MCPIAKLISPIRNARSPFRDNQKSPNAQNAKPEPSNAGAPVNSAAGTKVPIAVVFTIDFINDGGCLQNQI